MCVFFSHELRRGEVAAFRKKKTEKKANGFPPINIQLPPFILSFRRTCRIARHSFIPFFWEKTTTRKETEQNIFHATPTLICMRHAFHIFFTCVLDAFASPAINFYLIVCVCCANRLYNSVSVKRVEGPASRMLASICRLIRTCCFALSPA